MRVEIASDFEAHLCNLVLCLLGGCINIQDLSLLAFCVGTFAHVVVVFIEAANLLERAREEGESLNLCRDYKSWLGSARRTEKRAELGSILEC